MLFLLTILCLGQNAPPQTAKPRPVEERYVDGTLRFSIQPPANWQLIARREHLGDRTVVLRMVRGTQNKQLEQFILSQYESGGGKVEKLIGRAVEGLKREYSAVELISQGEQKIDNHPAGTFSASFRRDNAQNIHIETIVLIENSLVFSIAYEGPFELRSQSEPLFRKVAESLVFLRDQVSDKELREAFEAGKKLLSTLDEKKIRSCIIPEQTFMIEYQGQPVGCMQIQQAEIMLNKKPGIRVKERGWIFEPDGRVRRIQNSMYISYDLRNEKWKSSITVLNSANADSLGVQLGEGVRTDNVLLSNQTYDILEPAVTNPAITLPDMYLSRPLAVLLPQLIANAGQSQRLGFIEFDQDKAGVVVKIFETRGEPQNDRPIKRKQHKISVREGLAGVPEEMIVGDAGQINSRVIGRLRYRAATAKQVEQEFGQRITSADNRMNELEKQYQIEDERFTRPTRH